MTVTKRDIRRELLNRRLSLPSERKEEYDSRIRDLLKSLPEYRRAKRILLYCSVKGEPDLTPLFVELIDEGRSLILPRVKGESLELVEAREISCLKNGTFNIPEPDSGVITDPESVELAVVPGVVFDREGYRIGFGRGYYDRLLERVRAPKVGVAYSFQVLDVVPRDSWDVPVDMVVTEKGVIRRY